MAYDFQNSSDRIDFSNPSELHDLSPLTWSIWAQKDSRGVSGFGRLIVKGADRKIFYADTTDSVFFVDASTDVSRTFALANDSNVWVHLVVTWTGGLNATDIAIYKDGVQVTYTASQDGVASIVSDAGENFIVGNRPNGTRPFDGRLGEVGVWDVVLSGDEIKALSLGYKPQRVRPQSLLFSSSLVRNAQDIKLGAVATVTGATVAAHPRVY